MEENFSGFETKSLAEKMSGSIIAGTPEKQAASMLARVSGLNIMTRVRRTCIDLI
jgi:hypothetical protein